jgi:hypothetical protein
VSLPIWSARRMGAGTWAKNRSSAGDCAQEFEEWKELKSYLFSWILSLELAKRHYPDTMLVTDDQGRRILVDGLGLQFGNISTELNSLIGHDSGWWNTGKLFAYRLLKVPFLHLDSDVFLWATVRT